MKWLALCIVSVLLASAVSAQDISFKKASLSSSSSLKRTPVAFSITNTGISIHARSGTDVIDEILFADVLKISYGTTDRRRIVEGVLVAPILMATKAQDHWLVIEYSRDGSVRDSILQLDKSDFRGIIAALNARSGKHVEVLDTKSPFLDPSVGSHDVDERVAYPVRDVMPLIDPAMRAMGCDVRTRKQDFVECYRDPKRAGRTGMGGERVRVIIHAETPGTRVQIVTTPGMSHRNWSSPIFRELTRLLEAKPKV